MMSRSDIYNQSKEQAWENYLFICNWCFKALVGYPNSIQFHVFEIIRQLPKFSMYSLMSRSAKQSESCVEFRVNERIQRICLWVNQNFLLPNDVETENENYLKLHVKCLRDNTELNLSFEASGKIVFHTDNMALAADLLQSIASFLKVENLQVRPIFW